LKRPTNDQAEAPGQDSFLDVVANLVGILIILVMVVGAQAKKGLIAREAARAAAASISAPKVDVSAASSAALAVEQSLLELDLKIKREALEAQFRQQERDRMQLFVTVAEQRLAEHRGQLSEAERQRYDLQEQLLASRGELAKLSAAQTALTKPPPTVLQHLPTPMAKTVFGTELHLRLLGGRLAYVPYQEMVNRLQADAPAHVYKLKDAPRAEMSLPVVNGFGARYILRRADIEIQTRVGVARHGQILEKIYFVDAEPNLGVPLAEALQSGSELRSRLAGYSPQRTTVTVWVYPDSFDEFRQLKSELFKLGYLTAGRPLPMGHPISGAPDGSRSSAE
jgi:hypothetical protein